MRTVPTSMFYSNVSGRKPISSVRPPPDIAEDLRRLVSGHHHSAARLVDPLFFVAKGWAQQQENASEALGRITRSQAQAIESLQSKLADKELQNEELIRQVNKLTRRLKREELRKIGKSRQTRASTSTVVDESASASRSFVKPVQDVQNDRKRLRASTLAQSLQSTSAAGQHQAQTKRQRREDCNGIIVPTFRLLPVLLQPVRPTRKTMQERYDEDTYDKRHDKYERNERQIVRRDQIRQRQQEYHQKLLRRQMKSEARKNGESEEQDELEIKEIQIVKKLPPVPKCDK